MYGQNRNDAMREAFLNAMAESQKEQEDNIPVSEPNVNESEPDIDSEPVIDSVEGEPEVKEVEFATDYAQSMGMDPEEFYKLKLKLSDGLDPMTLGEMKDNVQAYEREKASIAKQREDLETYQKELQTQMMQNAQGGQVLSQRMKQAEARIEAIRQAVPSLEERWKAMQEKDPGSVALEKQQLMEHFNAAQQEYALAGQEAQQQQQYAYAQWIETQKKDLIQNIPKLADKKEMEEMWRTITGFASSRYGITPEELSRVDSRTIRLLIDAERGVKAAENAEKAISKVRARPTVGRGVRLGEPAKSKMEMQKLAEKARTSRRKEDVIAATRSVLEDAILNERG